MLQAVLRGNVELLVGSLLLGVLFALGGASWAKRKAIPAPLAVLLSISVAAIVSVTLAPVGDSAQTAGFCTITPISEGVLGVSGMLNIGLFVPFGFFLALLSRRPFLAMASAAALSGAIELLQGAVSVLARQCDTSDLIANSLGGIVGASVAAGVMRYFKTDRPDGFQWRIWSMVIGVACTVSLLAGIGLEWQATSGSSTSPWRPASQEEQERGERIAKGLLGDDVKITQIQLAEDNLPGLGLKPIAAVRFDGGLLYIEWSAGNPFYGQFGSSIGQRPITSLAPVSGGLQIDKNTAESRARDFAKKLKWASIAGLPAVIGGDSSRNFVASWRKRDRGILLPFRLDVTISSSGEIQGFDGAPVEITGKLPSVAVSIDEAKSLASSKIPTHKIGSVELLAEQIAGEWTPVWAIGLTLDGSAAGNRDRWVVVIDATKPHIIRTIDPSGAEV